MNDILAKLKTSRQNEGMFATKRQSWNARMREFDTFNLNPQFVKEHHESLNRLSNRGASVAEQGKETYITNQHNLIINTNHIGRSSNLNSNRPIIGAKKLAQLKMDPQYGVKMVNNQNHRGLMNQVPHRYNGKGKY